MKQTYHVRMFNGLNNALCMYPDAIPRIGLGDRTYERTDCQLDVLPD